MAAEILNPALAYNYAAQRLKEKHKLTLPAERVEEMIAEVNPLTKNAIKDAVDCKVSDLTDDEMAIPYTPEDYIFPKGKDFRNIDEDCDNELYL